MVGGEASAGPGPGDSRRGVPRGHAVEVQTLALLDISYGRLDGDHGGALIRCTDANRSGFQSSPLTFKNGSVSPFSTMTLMGALFEPMLLLPTHMYVPESETVTSGMSRVPMSVRVWGRTRRG